MQPRGTKLLRCATCFSDAALQTSPFRHLDKALLDQICACFVTAVAYHTSVDCENEDNYDEFCRQELDGCETGTTRKFLKNTIQSLLSINEAETVCALVRQAGLLYERAQSWRDREVAIFLVSAAVGRNEKRTTEERAVTKCLPFDLPSFVLSCICPVVDNAGSHMMLRIACMKFLHTCRFQVMTTAGDQQLLPVFRSLAMVIANAQGGGHSSQLCQTFAAFTLYGLLTVPGRQCTRLGDSFVPEMLRLLLSPAAGLHLLQCPQRDERFMKLTLRLMGASPRRELACLAERLLMPRLAEVLNAVVAERAQPCTAIFVHCLFECLAVLVQTANPAMLEATLTPAFHAILTTPRLQGYSSYVAQVLAFLIDTTRTTTPPPQPTPACASTTTTLQLRLPCPCLQLLPLFLQLHAWQREVTMPFLRVMKAYLRSIPPDMIASNDVIPRISAIFAKVAAVASTARAAFALLWCLTIACPRPSLVPYLVSCVSDVVAPPGADSATPSASQQREAVAFMSLLVAQHGVVPVMTALEQVSPSFPHCAITLLVDHASRLTSRAQRKVCAVCVLRLLLDPAVCSFQQLWAQLLCTGVRLLVAGVDDSLPGDNYADEDADESYTPLLFAMGDSDDAVDYGEPLPGVATADLRRHLAEGAADVLRRCPQLQPLCEATLPPEDARLIIAWAASREGTGACVV
eukprot:TRINITY_DN1393_c0_g1_i6.p1 TRINITY_DN1393_c0_g1~~TRINITY_DN1393_c0_g1_i6.p1  ORF type:complete len:689 (+),score=148.77 TRINITY_DN1393_c0_g1_i6:885-2951(+)